MMILLHVDRMFSDLKLLNLMLVAVIDEKSSWSGGVVGDRHLDYLM